MIAPTLALVAVLLIAASCGGAGATGECAQDRDCPEGSSCAQSVCTRRPDAGADGGRPQPHSPRAPHALDASAPDGGDAGAPAADAAILEPGSLDHASTLVEYTPTAVVRVVVPDDAHAFVVTATPPGENFAIRLARVVAPSGTLFTRTAADPRARTYLPNIDTGYPGLPYSFMLPNRPELELEPGTYTVALQVLQYVGGARTEALADGVLSVDVTLARGAAEPAGGRIDLLLLVFPDANRAAASAADDPTLVRAIAHANGLFAPAGIEIAEVDSVDVAPELIEAEGGDPGLIAAVLDEHVARAPAAIRVALLEYPEAGASYGIPGAPGRRGLLRSSMIAIDASVLSWPADIVARLLAHEIGHHLGLSHLTEEDFSAHDQLLDTPQCGPEALPGEEDAGAGADACEQARSHIMYWQGFSALPLQDVYFSPDQIWVMRRSPFLY